MKINDEQLEKLIDSIEDFARRKIADSDSNIDYIDNNYNLRKMKKSNNNIIEARRGCGKTTLILKSIYDNKDYINVSQDCQLFKDYSFTKILIELLNTINNSIILELQKIIKELEKERFLFIFYKKKKEIRKIRELVQKANTINSKLAALMKLPDEFTFEYTKNLNNEIKNTTLIQNNTNLKTMSSLELKYNQDFSQLESKLDAFINYQTFNKKEMSEKSILNTKINGSQALSKIDLLEDIKKVFIDFLKLTHTEGINGIYLYLDDFYMINKSYHPLVLKYFHDIYKNTKKGTFCFKIVTLPSSLQLNVGKEKIFSIKDDYSLIQLDYDLSNLDKIQTYLFEIIHSLSNIDITKQEFESLFSEDKTLKVLIIATGGIPRDFMKAFVEAIRIATRNSHNTIHKKDIYEVIKNLKDDKDRNIEIDSELSVESIEVAITELIDSLENKIKKNVILYPLDIAEKHEILLKNLVNLRYLHLIKPRVSSKYKKNYRAYLIDMTFYATGSISKNIEFCEFWEKDEYRNLDKLRKSPEWYFSNEIIEKIEIIESDKHN